MESKDKSADEQTSPSQFCQEVDSANSINSIMDNANSGNSGDCPKCSICKKRLARKSEYTVSECTYIPIYLLCFCVHISCVVFLMVHRLFIPLV